jgi:hypothetical protein
MLEERVSGIFPRLLGQVLGQKGQVSGQFGLVLGLAMSGPEVLHRQGDAKGRDHDQEHECSEPKSFHRIATTLTCLRASHGVKGHAQRCRA